MKTTTIYHNKQIKSLDELVKLLSGGVTACGDAPEVGTCECGKCYKYEITIEKITEYSKEDNFL